MEATHNFSKSEFLEAIKASNPPTNLKRVSAAYDFAKAAHAGQKRYSNVDYFTHVTECAYEVSLMKMDTSTICAALLHDTLEDTKTKPGTLQKEFGDEVLLLVEGVTKDLRSSATQHYRAENLRKVLLATAKDFRVIVIKLADRLHNMRTLRYLPEDSKKEIAKETLQIYVPIAYKLGMYRLKSELEDLCLKHLQPEIYQHLKTKISRKKNKREREIEKVIKSIRKQLGEAGIEAKVYGRAKNFYGIYKKMMKKGLLFEDIRDLAGVRIVVNTVEACYEALGIINSKWKPVDNALDDYIKSPKINHYQSLHTELIFNKKPVEIQIRTVEMHHVAEEGIAAHWQYKDTQRDKRFDRRISWLKQILDWRSADTARDLVESFKIDIFQNEIFVLTPKGDPIPLPEKSTPIDFAYAVHSEIGNHCKAAKINGILRALNFELKSGDVVQIITAKNSKPSRDWLNLARTGYAREKIRKAMGIKGEFVRKSNHILTSNDISVTDPNLQSMPLQLQRCCYIKAGEKICGIKAKHAISIHSVFCEKSKSMLPDKLVKLEWHQQNHITRIEMQIEDRTGIFADILGTLTSDDVKVNSINTKSAKNTLKLILQTSSDSATLDKAISKLKRIRNVISVET